jgi:phosphatidylinositol-3-phosphatase
MRPSFTALLFGFVAVTGCSGAGDEATSEDEAAVRRHDAGADAAHDAGTDAAHDAGGGTHAIQTVFLVLMENHNWSTIKGNASAPFINGTLLPMGSHAEGYVNVPGIHPSEPNYLWLESGSNLGVTNDGTPASNHQSTKSHLTTLLDTAGISWKAYAEGIDGTTCPLTTAGKYAPKHVPFVFFDDVTSSNSTTSAKCIAHVRPEGELATDLAQNTVARYNFITPDLCDDMHDSSGCATTDSVKNGDTWLSHALPAIFASKAYKNGGAVLITWDESENGDFPIGMIVLSPLAKGHGYGNTVAYSHSSTLRTMQEIFGVGPLLRDAAKATSLSDLFTSYP